MSTITIYIIIHYFLILALFGLGGTTLIVFAILHLPGSFGIILLFFGFEIAIVLLTLASYKIFYYLLFIIKLGLAIFLLIVVYNLLSVEGELINILRLCILCISSLCLSCLLAKDILLDK